MEQRVRDMLVRYAGQYEKESFLEGDPSWFMHQVSGTENQEAMAFVASCLSYGSRKQFMQKIQLILDWSEGDIDGWIRSGAFRKRMSPDDESCFYRLYTNKTMSRFLSVYSQLLREHNTLGEYVRKNATDGLEAVEAICRYFNQGETCAVVPKDAKSACKRVCMFLRWMVRDNSPVDLGLWADFIDRRTLIIPMDTHVLQQSVRLGLLNSRTATMSAAQRLSESLASVFPEDPMKGDFALFGYGVNNK